MQNVGEFQSDNTKNRVVLAVTLIASCDSKDCRAPVADKALAASVEDGLAAHNFASGTVDLISLFLAGYIYKGRNERSVRVGR